MKKVKITETDIFVDDISFPYDVMDNNIYTEDSSDDEMDFDDGFFVAEDIKIGKTRFRIIANKENSNFLKIEQWHVHEDSNWLDVYMAGKDYITHALPVDALKPSDKIEFVYDTNLPEIPDVLLDKNLNIAMLFDEDIELPNENFRFREERNYEEVFDIIIENDVKDSLKVPHKLIILRNIKL